MLKSIRIPLALITVLGCSGADDKRSERRDTPITCERYTAADSRCHGRDGFLCYWESDLRAMPADVCAPLTDTVVCCDANTMKSNCESSLYKGTTCID